MNVYGSKEVFVNEYKSLLAEKLLAKADYDTEQCVGVAGRVYFTCNSISCCCCVCDASWHGWGQAGGLHAFTETIGFFLRCREVRTLELLKLRFGESAFLSCEIMV